MNNDNDAYRAVIRNASKNFEGILNTMGNLVENIQVLIEENERLRKILADKDVHLDTLMNSMPDKVSIQKIYTADKELMKKYIELRRKYKRVSKENAELRERGF